MSSQSLCVQSFHFGVDDAALQKLGTLPSYPIALLCLFVEHKSLFKYSLDV